MYPMMPNLIAGMPPSTWGQFNFPPTHPELPMGAPGYGPLAPPATRPMHVSPGPPPGRRDPAGPSPPRAAAERPPEVQMCYDGTRRTVPRLERSRFGGVICPICGTHGCTLPEGARYDAQRRECVNYHVSRVDDPLPLDPQQARADRFCYLCHVFGHATDDCPNYSVIARDVTLRAPRRTSETGDRRRRQGRSPVREPRERRRD